MRERSLRCRACARDGRMREPPVCRFFEVRVRCKVRKVRMKLACVSCGHGLAAALRRVCDNGTVFQSQRVFVC